MSHIVGLETKYYDSQGKSLEVFEINWILGNLCNYHCSYCPELKHDGTLPGKLNSETQKVLSQLLDSLKTIQPYDLIRFNFSGGEPTVVPGFINFCRWLKEEYKCLIHINTNGSKPLKYWQENWSLFDTISMSFHAEFVKLDHYFKNFRFLTDNLFVFAAVMMHPKHWRDCIQLIDKMNQMERHAYGLNMLFKNWPREDMEVHPEYSAEQIEFFKKNSGEKVVNTDPSRCGITQEFVTHWSDGSSKKELGRQDIINKALNNFKTWRCWVGLKHMSILESGEIFTAGCHYKQKIGNLYSGEFRVPDSPIICGAQMCHCHPYLAIQKFHPEYKRIS